MKTQPRNLVLVALASSLFVLTACNTVSTSTTQALGVATYPPTNPTNVVVLLTPPTRPHVRLGEIQAEPQSTSTPAADIQAALQKAGAKLGADAVVIVYDRMQTMGAIVTGPWWGRSVQGITGRVVVGVAIKYTGQ
jgi:hypothetical protein